MSIIRSIFMSITMFINTINMSISMFIPGWSYKVIVAPNLGLHEDKVTKKKNPFSAEHCEYSQNC
jgi:hypothetical protein